MTKKEERIVFDAMAYGLQKIEKDAIWTPSGMTKFKDGVGEYLRNRHIKKGSFVVHNSEDTKLDGIVWAEAHEYLLLQIKLYRNELYQRNPEVNCEAACYKPTASFGPYIVNEDGSIDYGGQSQYHHACNWHEDEHHLSHMLDKGWVQKSTNWYIMALAYSAKIQGVQVFNINVERFYTNESVD